MADSTPERLSRWLRNPLFEATTKPMTIQTTNPSDTGLRSNAGTSHSVLTTKWWSHHSEAVLASAERPIKRPGGSRDGASPRCRQGTGAVGYSFVPCTFGCSCRLLLGLVDRDVPSASLIAAMRENIATASRTAGNRA